jgi:hypothetical protein
MSGIEFAQSMSALRKLLHFLPGETGQEHTRRIYATAEGLQAGTITWEQVQAEEQYRVERGLVQPRREKAMLDAERRAARDARWEAWQEAMERRERQLERPMQKPLPIREELEHPKQNKLKRARDKFYHPWLKGEMNES